MAYTNNKMISCRFIFFVSLFLLMSCNDNQVKNTSIIQSSLDDKSPYQEGIHYESLDKPFATRDPSKVEIIEFFWFSCGHCYNFERYIKAWKQGLAEDIDFYRSHITWNAQAETQARIMYAARALGVEEEAVAGVFHSIHIENQLMTGQSEVESFFRGLGISTEKYRAINSSFGVNNALSQANKRMRGYDLRSVPAFTVNGKYKVVPTNDLSSTELLKVLDFLIEKEKLYLAKKD
tara:strand:+ start:3845 stop:4549 length:705 start_codon:yes stop_codon:yes gene_type:complete